jgi:hypothetical protein
MVFTVNPDVDPMEFIESPITPVATTIIIELVDPRRTHCFAGVVMWTDDTASTAAAPTAGKVVIEVMTTDNPQAWEAASGSPIEVLIAKRRQVSFAGNAMQLRGVPSGITADATHWQIIMTCNIS